MSFRQSQRNGSVIHFKIPIKIAKKVKSNNTFHNWNPMSLKQQQRVYMPHFIQFINEKPMKNITH